MNSTKSLILAGIVALACGTPLSYAGIGDVYSATFQGVTFTITETAANSMSFELAGTTPLAPDWQNANYLASFDFKDLGINFSTATGTAYDGPGVGSGLLGLNNQLNNSNIECGGSGSPPGGICFDIANSALGTSFDFLYNIVFSSNLNIASTGPHLQIAFTTTADATQKTGTLYSQNIALSSSSGTKVPEPSSSSLTLLGLAVIGVAMWTRRRRMAATA